MYKFSIEFSVLLSNSSDSKYLADLLAFENNVEKFWQTCWFIAVCLSKAFNSSISISVGLLTANRAFLLIVVIATSPLSSPWILTTGGKVISDVGEVVGLKKLVITADLIGITDSKTILSLDFFLCLFVSDILLTAGLSSIVWWLVISVLWSVSCLILGWFPWAWSLGLISEIKLDVDSTTILVLPY